MSRARFTRRSFLAGASGAIAAGFARPALAAAAASFTPERFGAAGDGVRDDYAAFAKLVAAVNSAGGGTISFTRGRTYRLGRHLAPGNGVADLIFEGCDGLTFEGKGGRIAVEGDFARQGSATRGLSGLWIQDSRNIVVRDLELDGNVGETGRPPKLAESGAMCGINLRSCSDVVIDNVYAHHFATDGLLIRDSASTDGAGRRRVCRNVTVRNSRFLFNARQGMTVAALRGGSFENCDFSYTGYVDKAGRMGRYGAHSPAAGVDIEPDKTPTHGEIVDALTGDLTFHGCRMVGNYGATFLASKYAAGQYFQEEVRLQDCLLECNDGETGGVDGFIFDVPGGEVTGCTLQMKDKTAYLGWYRGGASPRFAMNIVYGRNPGANRYMFALKPTGGAPVVEGNRFIGQHQRPKPAGGSWLLFLDNPRAVFRANQCFLPKEAYAAPADGLMRAVYANAGRMEGNRYTTDLRHGAGSRANARLGILYSAGSEAVGERFAGTEPGPRDTIGPGDAATQRARGHDTTRPWSKLRGR